MATNEIQLQDSSGRVYYYNLDAKTLWTDRREGEPGDFDRRIIIGDLKEQILSANKSRLEAANTTEVKQSFNLGSLSVQSRAAAGSSLSYPRRGTSEGGIAADADYVMFQFYNYAPPYGGQRQQIKSGVYAYNQEFKQGDTQVSEYKPAGENYKPILMYMPPDISSGFQTGWAAKTMSNVGRNLMTALARQNIFGEGSKVSGVVNAAKELVESGGALGAAAAVKSTLNVVGGDALSYDDIFSGISGAIKNPNTELFFSGVDVRNFTLSFTLVPRYKEEAIDIVKIVKQFQAACLPSKDPGKVLGFNGDSKNTGITTGFIGLPKLCRVSFMHGPKEHSILPRYKMCALVSVGVNYTPDGSYATYNDDEATPVAIKLDLSFQETKICFADEVLNGVVR